MKCHVNNYLVNDLDQFSFKEETLMRSYEQVQCTLPLSSNILLSIDKLISYKKLFKVGVSILRKITMVQL